MKKYLIIVLVLFVFKQDAFSAVDQNYFIGPEDILDIKVWENPQLSTLAIVRPDGKITMPLIGDVEANVEATVLKKILETKLVNYIKDPIVTVSVQSINNFKVYLMGRGVTPQVISLKRNTGLMQLLSQTGPLLNANLEEAYLLRDKERLKINFYNLVIKGDLSQDLSLMPNDIVFIPDNFDQRIQIIGAVRKPQTIYYREGLNIIDAFLFSDGFTDFAKTNNISVFRKNENKVEEIEIRYKDLVNSGDIKNNILLKPGDLIVVKEGIF